MKSAFDTSAKNYDQEFTNTAIGMLQRNRVYKYLNPLLNSNKTILEINCGTGEDAIYISGKVKTVLATDVSEEMIKIAENKKKDNPNLKFEVQNILGLHKSLSGKFDSLFSNFGGLNCLTKHEIIQFSENISPFISKKGKLVIVVMSKKCWIENFWFFLKKDKRIYRRDTELGIDTEIGGTNFKTYYYSPKEIGTFFIPNFKVKKIKSVGLFIPPSYLNSLFITRKGLLSILNFFEKLLGGFSFFANYADHYLLVLEKK